MMEFETEEDSIRQDGSVVRAKTVRRHGACNPCKAAKTKCDGAEPCGACRSEKRKSRTCEYSDKARGIAAAREEGAKRRKRGENDAVLSEEAEHFQTSSECSFPSGIQTPNPMALMHRRMSLFGVVEEFMEVKSSKGRILRNIKRVQTLWVELQRFIKGSGLAGDPFTLLTEDNSMTHESTGGKQAQSMVDLWKTQCSKIEYQINNGQLKLAWDTIPSLKRQIESWELFAKDNAHPPTERELEHINIIRLRLFDLDFAMGFYLGGISSLATKAEPKFPSLRSDQIKSQDDYFPSKVELFSTLQDILRIDMSHEGGVWEFLRFFHAIKANDPATTLEKLAMCITNKAPPEKLALKMAANLTFAMMYCRTASVCAYYSRQECVIPPLNSGTSDIVQEMRLHLPRQKGNECSQVIKHAGNVLEAFGVLCDIDAEETAAIWFRSYGALIAAVLIGIAGLRDKNADWNGIRIKLDNVEAQLKCLKVHNPRSTIFDKAVGILQEFNSETGSRMKLSKAQTTNTRKISASTSPDNKKVKIPLSMKKPSFQKDAAIRSRKRSFDAMASLTRPMRAKKRRQIIPDPPGLTSTGSSIAESNDVGSDCPAQNSDIPFIRQAFHCSQSPGYAIDASFLQCASIPFTEPIPPEEIVQTGELLHSAQHCNNMQNDPNKRPPILLGYPRFHVPLSYTVLETENVQHMDSGLPSQQMPCTSNNSREHFCHQDMQTSGHTSEIISPGFPQIETISPSRGLCHSTVQSDGQNAQYFNMTAKHFEPDEQSHETTSANMSNTEPVNISEHECQAEGESSLQVQFNPAISARLQSLNGECQYGSNVNMTNFRSISQAPLLRRASEPAWLRPEQYSISPQGYPFHANEEQRDEMVGYSQPTQMLQMPDHDIMAQSYHYNDYQNHQPLYQSISMSF